MMYSYTLFFIWAFYAQIQLLMDTHIKIFYLINENNIFIIDTLETGGSERVLTELSNFLSNKYKIFIITISQPNKVKDFYTLNKNIKKLKIFENLKNENFLIKILRFISLSNKLSKIIIKEKPRACISFLTFSNLLNVFCSLIYKNTKCIISERINPK